MSNIYTSLQNLSIFDQLQFVKSQAKRFHRLNSRQKPYKSYLNLYARKCGYDSYDSLFRLFKIELDTARNIGKDECSSRPADLNKDYFFLTMHGEDEYGYFSHWTGWDEQGYELRAPSKVNPEWFIKLVRQSLKEPLYIIHDKDDCLRWMFSWKGKALIDSDLAIKSIPSITIPKRSYNHPRLDEAQPM